MLHVATCLGLLTLASLVVVVLHVISGIYSAVVKECWFSSHAWQRGYMLVAVTKVLHVHQGSSPLFFSRKKGRSPH